MIARRSLARVHRLRSTTIAARYGARTMADNLLGYSPMAAPAGTSGTGTMHHIPTVHEAKISGIWQATTAKRDKLAELKIEAKDGDLDAMATPEQLNDLYLVDGVSLIVQEQQRQQQQQLNDEALFGNDTTTTVASEVTVWLEEMAASQPDELNAVEAEELVRRVELGVGQRLLLSSSYGDGSDVDKKDELALSRHVRDFLDASIIPDFHPSDRSDGSDDALQRAFDDAVTRFQWQRIRATAKQFSWETYTVPTDAGIDRAAARHGSATVKRSTIRKDKLLAVLAQGSLPACWDLMAKDDDGLLDQQEMNQVCDQVLKTAKVAVKDLMSDALGEPVSRKDKRNHRRCHKDFDRTLKQHFEYELELPHRLRCIYTWANKAHQSNKIDSVVVEEEGGGIATSVMGRKRYVELHPKISLDEFQEVQKIHLPELDEPALEYLRSYRSDLLVKQGKGRQNRDVMRDCSLFFTGVCVVDYVVLSL
jgi:hypothetical protein